MSTLDVEVILKVEQLNRDYVRALDGKNMQAWLDTFDSSGSYICISEENERRGFPIAYMLDDCYERLQDRKLQVEEIQDDSIEHYQPRHFTQLIDVEEIGEGRYRAETNFSVNYTPADTGRTAILATGRYIDEVLINGEARYIQRKAVVDTNVLPRYIAYPI